MFLPPLKFQSLVNRPMERERAGEFREVFTKLISQTLRKGKLAQLGEIGHPDGKAGLSSQTKRRPIRICF